MPCVPCSLEYHNECISPVCINDSDSMYCCCSLEDKTRPIARKVSNTERDDLIPGTRGRSLKESSTVTDPQSTGRKRAALDFPLDKEALCEWAELKYAGGGLRPIVGCPGDIERNPQRHRHHGPDKNTLNNTEGNVHRICHYCHNRWHATNDPGYNSRKPETFNSGPDNEKWHTHDGITKATIEEIAANEIYYANTKLKKVSDDEHS